MPETLPAHSAETVLAPALLDALAREAGAHPLDRKLLVCRRLGDGREVLRALAASGVGWIGFEVTTPRGLAHELMASRLAELGLKSTDEFDELALLDDAVDAVLARGGGTRLRDLAEGTGFRQAIANAVSALRLAGIDAATLERVPLRDVEKRDALVRILGEYERRLTRSGRVDGVAVFRMANQALASGTGALQGVRTYLFPGQDRRGLSGRLLELLVERGATVLPADGVAGLTAPPARLVADAGGEGAPRTRLGCLHDVGAAAGRTAEPAALSLFTAASIQDELREVLRRVVAARLPWDAVEIIATDALTYGAALDALAQRLGIPVTYSAGLPLERTRPGRALAGYIRWIQEDFPEDVIRGMIERGDVAAPGDAGGGAGLARRLRRMRIGRGRDRYESALAQAERWVERPLDPDDDRPEDEVRLARAQEREQVAALGALLRPVLAATPPLPDRLRLNPLPVRPSDLARGARAFLDRVPALSPIDVAARTRLLARLERLQETATRATTLDAAIAVLTSRLDTRVPAPDTGGTAPWNAAGGHLHLSDLEHGGFTGRLATFIVGLDAARFPGGGLQDPLLVDDDRHRLNTGQTVGSMTTTGERLTERRFAFAELLARLRGQVTCSYSAWDAAEARTVPPAAEMLQAFRLLVGDATADYDRMHGELAAVASAVPRRAERLDGADVWLAALDNDGVMRDGRRVVCSAYGGLGRGLRAASAKREAVLGPHQGRIEPRRVYDPRDNSDVVVSSSRLEWLGACPRRYLLRYVLNVRPPDDPELEPDRWLSPRDRGALLHTVFERALQAARDADIGEADERFLEGALTLLDHEMAAWRERLPPAGDAVYQVEAEALKDDVRAFVRMVRQDGPDWVALERKFGRDGAPPVTLALPGGAITLAGAIDRIDRVEDGDLVIIDYKTGGTYDYRRDTGIYRGGRRLQHVLYAAVAEQLYAAAVARAEYHFPTVKGRAERAVYTSDELLAGLGVVDRLLSIAARGHFFPTDAADDCRWCDYRAVCRVKVDGTRVVSPAADWSARVARDVEELHVMRELRKSP